MTRPRLLALLAILIGGSLSFLNFDWYTISMAPNGKVTNLATFSGASAHPSVQAVAVLGVLEFVLVLISKGRLARGFAASLSVTSLAALALAVTGFANLDLSAQKSQIINLKNIAAAHDVASIATNSNSNPWFFFALTLSIAIVAGFSSTRSALWTATRSRSAKTSDEANSSAEDDTISLWESQRQPK